MTPAEERPAERQPGASQPPSEPAIGGQAGLPVPQVGGVEPWPPTGPPGERTPSISQSPRASNADRNVVAEQLRDAFADGRLDEDEFDVRIQAALSARTRNELEPLLADLVPAATVGPIPAQRPMAPVAAGGGPQHSLAVAVMGGTERKGRWRVAPTATAVAIMGGVELDLRMATLTSQVTTIRALAIMGGIDIIVPPGVRVEMTGIPLMGGGDERVDDEHLSPTAPLIKVQWIALMGGVSVRTKAPKGKEIAKEDRRELGRRRPRRDGYELED